MAFLAGRYRYRLTMSWDDAFSLRYDEWSAHMTADVGLLARVSPLKPTGR